MEQDLICHTPQIEEALQADRDKLARIQEAMQQRSRKREVTWST